MKRTMMMKAFLVSLLFGTLSIAAEPSPVAPKTGDELKENASPVAESRITLKIPLLSPKFASVPVATVGDDVVTMEEFNQSLAALHQRAGEDESAGKKDYNIVLNRLINSKLIVQEAENMGLADLPEVKEKLEDFPRMAIKEELKEQQIKDLKPAEADTERFYKEAVKELKVKSVRFDKEDDAKELARAVQAGGNFDELANSLIESGKATGVKEGEFVKAKELLPQVAHIVSSLRVGGISPVVQVGPAYTILKLEDIRYPADDMEAREAAREQALALKQLQVLTEYNGMLVKKYAKIDRKLLDKLDFESAKPGFDKLLKDKRVIATIKGDKPITVADLGEMLKQKFFHGVKEAAKGKRINEQKMPALYDIFYARLYPMEAKKLGLDKTESYKNRIKDFRDSLLFGMFIQKVVASEIKVTDEEIKAHYNAEIDEFSLPEMLKLRGLAFTRKDFAEAAMEKLQKGTEYQWLQANAEGLVPGDTEGLMSFSQTPVTRKSLPEKMQEAIAAAKPGEYRLFETPEGFVYVIQVQEVIPAKPQPLEQVKQSITKEVFNQKLNKSVEDWGQKLREAYKVQVYITDLGN
ncbi:hypothetical protein Geob_3161 [Geotalea daltonii FRC-32]|uniref:Periplasmic chaperone PpiD n=1 Tax=Geotalea daltonii (strain DSM 22248 / JCM 15807 / FRC-32) TaxID=316067 RepID=B9M449_GEODF|nr:peptidyl-prolyl cis-trans isomerase [Geotalea daltonii]ACM21504.1 hypothetical protein Geob_3161 [Geotalea daltonii FRC-32]